MARETATSKRVKAAPERSARMLAEIAAAPREPDNKPCAGSHLRTGRQAARTPPQDAWRRCPAASGFVAGDGSATGWRMARPQAGANPFAPRDYGRLETLTPRVHL